MAGRRSAAATLPASSEQHFDVVWREKLLSVNESVVFIRAAAAAAAAVTIEMSFMVNVHHSCLMFVVSLYSLEMGRYIEITAIYWYVGIVSYRLFIISVFDISYHVGDECHFFDNLFHNFAYFFYL